MKLSTNSTRREADFHGDSDPGLQVTSNPMLAAMHCTVPLRLLQVQIRTSDLGNILAEEAFVQLTLSL